MGEHYVNVRSFQHLIDFSITPNRFEAIFSVIALNSLINPFNSAFIIQTSLRLYDRSLVPRIAIWIYVEKL